MRPVTPTRAAVSSTHNVTLRASSHGAATPIATRTGIKVGENSGISESTWHTEFSGSAGSTLIASMYGTMISVRIGAVTPPTSSWRDTIAPAAANSSAYITNPTTNQ